MNKLFITLLVALVFVNIGVFVRGVRLSDDINMYEKELRHLKRVNTEYEYKIFALDSIAKNASDAAVLGYGSYNTPLYTDRTAYAYNQ